MALTLAWGLAVFGGLAGMWAYAEAAAPPPEAGPAWPVSATLGREAGRLTLVMAVHPKCPCSRASLAELRILLARVPRRPVVDVLVFRPADVPAGWEATGLWTAASAIPGVHVIRDDEGRQARVFGTLASGSVLLYSADGRLLFSGGITSARGHEGDNAGLEALVSLLTDARPAASRFPVFGCLLGAVR